MAVQIRRRLFTIEEWDRMIEVGIFPEDERLELIRGEIIATTPVEERHFGCVRRLNYRLNRCLGTRAVVDVQNSVWLGDQQSYVYPDVSVLRKGFLSDQVPKPEDVVLAVEVSDSSLAYDLSTKIPLYAESGILETWLVDLNSKTIFVYRQPSPEGYGEMRPYQRGDVISPEAFPEARLTAESILG